MINKPANDNSGTRLSDLRASASKPSQVEILARATLALRYARRGAISQSMADAMGELLTSYSKQAWV